MWTSKRERYYRERRWSRLSEFTWETNDEFPTQKITTLGYFQVFSVVFLFLSFNPDLSSLYNSADNRDYCEYIHVRPGDSDDTTNPHDPIREVTVKSFSMSVHIRRPGFQLLSLVDPAKLANPSLKSFADTPCLLPDQYRIYTSFYAPCILFTFLILVLLNISRARFHAFRTIPSPIHSSSGRASPNPMVNTDPGLWSATWSPYTTLPVSPPHTRAGTATMLVASQSGSPSPVSPSFVLPYSDADEDEEDTLYPTKYTVRRDSHKLREDDGWSHVGRSREEEAYEIVSDQEPDGGNSAGHQIQPEFITPPGHARHLSSMRRQKGWSYTFMLGGQGRRITLRLPTWTSLHNLFDLFALSGSDLVPRRRRGRWMSVFLDGLSVFWPAAIVWVIINWTIL